MKRIEHAAQRLRICEVLLVMTAGCAVDRAPLYVADREHVSTSAAGSSGMQPVLRPNGGSAGGTVSEISATPGSPPPTTGTAGPIAPDPGGGSAPAGIPVQPLPDTTGVGQGGIGGLESLGAAGSAPGGTHAPEDAGTPDALPAAPAPNLSLLGNAPIDCTTQTPTSSSLWCQPAAWADGGPVPSTALLGRYESRLLVRAAELRPFQLPQEACARVATPVGWGEPSCTLYRVPISPAVIVDLSGGGPEGWVDVAVSFRGSNTAGCDLGCP